MSITISYPFTTASNYTFDDTKIEIDAGKAKLKLQQGNVNFTEDFADDTGFTYDNTKTEFTGGLVRQKDQTGDALFGVNFTIDQNANFSTGSGTGTLNGGAIVSNGKLDLSGGVLAYALYNPTNNLGINQGTIRFRLTPKYSDEPPSYQYIISTEALVGIAGEITLFHTTSRNLAITIRDNVGNLIFSSTAFGYWGQIADQEYEFELNFNFDVGGSEIRLFIDGVQLGSTLTTGMTSTTRGRFYVGCEWSESTNINILVDDILLFDTVQHIANYTPGYTVPSYIYVETSVILPEMEHTGDGTIKLFNTFSTTETGSPRYTLQIGRSGNYLYWNGSAWVVSDGTYSQANDVITFNTNCPTLDVDGENYGQFKIIFPDSNTISSVSELTANMNVDIGYPTTNPTIETNTTFRSDGLEGFTETSTITGSDNIKHILKQNSNYYYWNGTAWAVSNETYAQSNTATEIETNKASFLTEGSGKVIKVKSFLHSVDGTTKPDLDNISINYNYSGDALVLTEVIIYGYLRDIVNGLESETIKVRPHWIVSDKSIIAGIVYEYTTLEDGYFEITMSYEDDAPDYLEWRIKNKIYKTNFLEQDFVKFGELTILWQNTLNIDVLGT